MFKAGSVDMMPKRAEMKQQKIEKKMQMQAGPHKMAAITIQREQHMPKKVCKKWRKRLKTVPRKLCV